MLYLSLVTLVWAFSFGMIGHYLAGLDPYFIAAIRLSCAWLLLIPFFRIQQVPKSDWLMLASRGAIQYGLMYICYIKPRIRLPTLASDCAPDRPNASLRLPDPLITPAKVVRTRCYGVYTRSGRPGTHQSASQ